MTDIQGALGLSQHGRLDEFVARRRAIARIYDAALAGLPLILPYQDCAGDSAFHLYVVQVDAAEARVDRGTVFERLRKSGIGVNVHYIPVHTQPYYRRLGFERGQFPAAERYYMNAISLPMFAGLQDGDIARVVSALEQALHQ